jgi:outer membrane protein assembly factor BamB
VVESPKSLIVTTTEHTPDSSERYDCLYVLNTDGSIKWVKKFKGSALFPHYSKGVIYLQESISDEATNVGYDSLYAFNAESGAVLWVTGGNSTDHSDFFSFSVTTNDSLVFLSTYNELYAFDIKSGNVKWIQRIKDLSIYTPVLDKNIAYLVTAPLYTALYSIIAYNLETHNILWTNVIGYNPVSGVTVVGDRLVFVTGAGTCVGLDKNTGQTVWQNSDNLYRSSIVNGNTLYATTQGIPQGLVAIDADSGKVVWKHLFSDATYFNHTYCYKNRIYGLGGGDTTEWQRSFDMKTGDSAITVPINSPYTTMDYLVSGTSSLYVVPWQDNKTIREVDPESHKERSIIYLPQTAYSLNWMGVISSSDHFFP